MSETEQLKMLDSFLKSKYVHVRRRGYTLLSKAWSPKVYKNVVFAWGKYNDYDLINIIINKMSPDELKTIYKSLIRYFKEEEYEGKLDFPLLLQRNRLYVKIISFISNEIEKLKKRDPVSYVYIMKETNNAIAPDYLLQVYKNIPSCRNYLPFWIGQMKMWDVLKKIDVSLTKKG
jgi:hypothetical protein